MSTNDSVVLALPSIPTPISQGIWFTLGILIIIINAAILLLIHVSRHRLKGQTYTILSSSFVICIIFAIWNNIIVEFASYFPNIPPVVYALVCTFAPALNIYFMGNFNLHLCLTSADRYIYVMYPYNYKKIVSKKAVGIAIGLVWILPVASILSLVTYRNINFENCTYDYEFSFTINLADAISATAVSAVIFFIPLFVVIIVYTRIFFVIKSHTKELYAGRDSAVVGKKVNKNMKAIIQMVLLIGVFVVMWMPLTLMVAILPWCTALIDPTQLNLVLIATLALVFRFLAYSYPLLHPILYCYFNPPLKMELLRYIYQWTGKEDLFRQRLQTGQGTLFSVNERKQSHVKELNISSINDFKSNGYQDNHSDNKNHNGVQVKPDHDKKTVSFSPSYQYFSSVNVDDTI